MRTTRSRPRWSSRMNMTDHTTPGTWGFSYISFTHRESRTISLARRLDNLDRFRSLRTTHHGEVDGPDSLE